jgi:inhibitor of cysteine peptidase
VDLSNPRDPKIAGELKVPGYSEYIHMLDDTHLLTIGKDALPEDGFAWYLGVKISIFDVTDLANPTQLHTATIGVRGTDSEALRNHKAFTYHNGLLAFPIDLYEGDITPPNYGNYTFGGLMVYSVSVDTGLKEVGRIATVNQDGPYYWDYNQWTRGVFIGESVYAICDHDIKAAATADMTTLQGAVDLP